MNLKDSYNKLPQPLQYIVIGAGIFLGYKLVSKLFTTGSEQLTQNVLNTNEDDIKKFAKQGLLPSFEISQYPIFANIIYESTKYGVGDSYGSVVDTLTQLKNNLDVALLIRAYGTKQNYVFGIPTGEKRDLFTNVQAELGNEFGGLTSYRITQINNNWSSKGITYKL
jgi:hypothetical protein